MRNTLLPNKKIKVEWVNYHAPDTHRNIKVDGADFCGESNCNGKCGLPKMVHKNTNWNRVFALNAEDELRLAMSRDLVDKWSGQTVNAEDFLLERGFIVDENLDYLRNLWWSPIAANTELQKSK